MDLIPTHITGIIFDLGGVLLNIDYRRTRQAFEQLGGKKFSAIYSQFLQTRIFDDFETGRITADTFREGVRQALGISLTDHQIDEAWNAMLLDFPASRLDLLQRLNKRYKCLLLSNTNDIHYRAFHAIIRDAHGLDGLEPYFDGLYYSHRMGFRKPQPEVYQFILEDQGLEAADTLFIDDSPQHVEGARRVGLRAIHLDTDTEQVADYFTDYLTE